MSTAVFGWLLRLISDRKLLFGRQAGTEDLVLDGRVGVQGRDLFVRLATLMAVETL